MVMYVDPRGVISPSPVAPGIDAQVKNWAANNRVPTSELLKQKLPPIGAAPGIAPTAAPTAPAGKPIGTMTRIGAGVGLNLAANLLPDGSAAKSGVQNGATALMVPGMPPPLAAAVGIGGAMKQANNNQAIAQGFNGGKAYGQYRQEQEQARDQDRMAADASAGLQHLIAQGIDPAKAAKIAKANAKLYGSGNAAAQADEQFRQVPGNMLDGPAMKAQGAAPGQVVPAAPEADLRTQLRGEDPYYSAPVGAPAYRPVPQFNIGKIQTKNAPLDPAAWAAENPSTFGAAPGVQVARKQYGNDTVRALKDAKGNVTFTNLADNNSMQQFASAGKGVSNNLNADGSTYDAKAHQAQIAKAEGELHQARIAALDENAPGLRKRSTAEMLQERANSPLHAVRNQALATLTQQQQMAINQQQHQGELALRAPGVQLDNAGKALTLQSHQDLASLHQKYLGLNDTNDAGGVQRKSLASQILTMQGKAPPGLEGNKFKVVEVGGGIDPGTMQALPKNAYLLNQETGQAQPFGEKSGKSLSQADYAELVKRYAAQGVNEETVKQHLASNGYQVGK